MNPVHLRRYGRRSPDDMQDMVDDGYFEDGPPDEDVPGWYRRGRASRVAKTEQAASDTLNKVHTLVLARLASPRSGR